MSRRRLTYMITMGIKQFRDPYYQGFAAQLAFYFLLAVVPTVMIISQIIANMEIISMDRIVSSGISVFAISPKSFGSLSGVIPMPGRL